MTGCKGYEFPPYTFQIEKGQVKLFLKAINETGELYTNEEAARAAGYRSTLVPPTMLGFGTSEEPFDFLEVCDMNFKGLLHAGQTVTQHQVICVGDVLTERKKVADYFEKKGGALTFAVITIDFYNQQDELVYQSKQTLICRKNVEAES